MYHNVSFIIVKFYGLNVISNIYANSDISVRILNLNPNFLINQSTKWAPAAASLGQRVG